MAPKSRTIRVPANPYSEQPNIGTAGSEEEFFDEVLRVLRQLLGAASRASRALLRITRARLLRQARGWVITGRREDQEEHQLAMVLENLGADIEQMATDLEIGL